MTGKDDSFSQLQSELEGEVMGAREKLSALLEELKELRRANSVQDETITRLRVEVRTVRDGDVSGFNRPVSQERYLESPGRSEISSTRGLVAGRMMYSPRPSSFTAPSGPTRTPSVVTSLSSLSSRNPQPWAAEAQIRLPQDSGAVNRGMSAPAPPARARSADSREWTGVGMLNGAGAPRLMSWRR